MVNHKQLPYSRDIRSLLYSLFANKKDEISHITCISNNSFLISESVSIEEDKLLHTLQTVGRLSNKATKRIFANVVHHLRTLQKDHLNQYLNQLVEFLQMAHFINAYRDRKPSNGISGSTAIATSNGHSIHQHQHHN